MNIPGKSIVDTSIKFIDELQETVKRMQFDWDEQERALRRKNEEDRMHLIEAVRHKLGKIVERGAQAGLDDSDGSARQARLSIQNIGLDMEKKVGATRTPMARQGNLNRARPRVI